MKEHKELPDWRDRDIIDFNHVDSTISPKDEEAIRLEAEAEMLNRYEMRDQKKTNPFFE